MKGRPLYVIKCCARCGRDFRVPTVILGTTLNGKPKILKRLTGYQKRKYCDNCQEIHKKEWHQETYKRIKKERYYFLEGLDQ